MQCEWAVTKLKLDLRCIDSAMYYRYKSMTSMEGIKFIYQGVMSPKHTIQSSRCFLRRAGLLAVSCGKTPMKSKKLTCEIYWTKFTLKCPFTISSHGCRSTIGHRSPVHPVDLSRWSFLPTLISSAFSSKILHLPPLTCMKCRAVMAIRI